jgi:hypothetical protein
MYAQPDLMDAETEALLPERPGVVDLYFLAFAGEAKQDVFMKEALFAKELLDRRFDTGGRSIALVNNRATSADRPLATVTNLRTALAKIGETMNPEEDVLLLFVTSHGSEEHVLSVQYPALPLLEIGAKDLADALDESRVGWRVVVISACYSGGFIEALKNDHTLVITAAAADRKSFGCNNEADFTYFGKAFFEDQLEKQFSFSLAFAAADAEILRREIADGLEPSRPQIWAPAPILEKLGELEHRLSGMIASSLPLNSRPSPAPPLARVRTSRGSV